MKRAILAAVATMVTGCCNDAPTDRLEMVGNLPPGTDAVIEVAQEHCGRELAGRVAFVTEPRSPDLMGYCAWGGDGCPMDAWVLRILMAYEGQPYESPATGTALAHELGHWCLRSEDERRVDQWAAAVNHEAACRLGELHCD